jgi:hypothetical protein
MMSILHLIELPTFVSSVNFRIAESAGVRTVYFNFDPANLIPAESATIYYPASGAIVRGVTGSVILERRSERIHVAVFDQVAEALAALALLPIYPDYKIPANADDHRLAETFLTYCVDHQLVARCNSPEATNDEIERLRCALKREREAMAFL